MRWSTCPTASPSLFDRELSGGRARPARTPPLDLPFRDYFAQPKDGVLWRSPPPAVLPRPIGCRIGGPQDEESLIPCLVDGLPQPSKRVFGVSGAPGRTPGGIEAPYFLERIDSVIGGRLETVLAIHSGVSAKPVAVAAVSLNALDRAVPPRHMDLAVVDRETGRTLFHSDDDLAMTTYFAEDTGRDPALRSLLRSGARDTIELDYAGVPIRAHVRPLRPGLPWTLVVYRGHELQDRLGGLTAGSTGRRRISPSISRGVCWGSGRKATWYAKPNRLWRRGRPATRDELLD